jgi:hypothetical protein
LVNSSDGSIESYIDGEDLLYAPAGRDVAIAISSLYEIEMQSPSTLNMNNLNLIIKKLIFI